MDTIDNIRVDEKQLIKKLITTINQLYSENLNSIELTDYGVGKIGVSFSQINKFFELFIYYDAMDDCFIMFYKSLNQIINDLEIKICIDEKDINPFLADYIKVNSINDFKDHHMLSKKDLSKIEEEIDLHQNEIIQMKINAIYSFQKIFPNSYIGGSLSLLLRDINLNRSLYVSDLDLITENFDMAFYLKELKKNNSKTKEYKSIKDDVSNFDDFNYHFKLRLILSSPSDRRYLDSLKLYVKHDVAIRNNIDYDIVDFHGRFFKVAKIKEVIFYKKKYYKKYQQEKHKNDLDILKKYKSNKTLQ